MSQGAVGGGSVDECCGRLCVMCSVSRCRSSALRSARGNRWISPRPCATPAAWAVSAPPCAASPDPRRQWARLRELTDRPFAINHTMRPLDPDAFAATLHERPAAISFHIGDPGDLVQRAHDAGILWIQQVFDLDQARRAVDRGADVIIAQGGEAGGNGGLVATMVMVPAVVDLAGDVPGRRRRRHRRRSRYRRGARARRAGRQPGHPLPRHHRDADQRPVEAGDPARRSPRRGQGRLRRRGPAAAVARRRARRAPGAAHRTSSTGGTRTSAAPAGDRPTPRPSPDRRRRRTARRTDPFTGQSAALIHDVAPAAELVARIITHAETALRGQPANQLRPARHLQERLSQPHAEPHPKIMKSRGLRVIRDG